MKAPTLLEAAAAAGRAAEAHVAAGCTTCRPGARLAELCPDGQRAVTEAANTAGPGLVEPECAHGSWEVTSEHRTPAGWVKARRCADCSEQLEPVTEAEPHWPDASGAAVQFPGPIHTEPAPSGLARLAALMRSREQWRDGRLVALADDPTVVIQAVGGGQGVFPQAFTITPADPPPLGTLSPRRQAAYDAVYELIGRLGSELPPGPVHRNAMIWRAVNAALDAAGIQVTDNPEDPTADTVLIARDTAEDTVLAAGGHVRTTTPGDGPRCDLTSGVPVRPHPEDTRDTGGVSPGDARPGGVRFAYRATVRRGQVRHAIAEAFDLLDRELHPRRPGLEEGDGRDA